MSGSRPPVPSRVYLAGIVCNNGVKLIKDIGAVLGKGVTLAAPDGFTPYSATAGAGAAAQGMYISYAGVPLSLLGAKGKAFLKAFAKYQGRSVVDPYAVYAAQTAQIMLNAIAQLEWLASLRRQATCMKTNVQGRHHGHLQVRQERGHLPVQDDQLRQAGRDVGQVLLLRPAEGYLLAPQ